VSGERRYEAPKELGHEKIKEVCIGDHKYALRRLKRIVEVKNPKKMAEMFDEYQKQLNKTGISLSKDIVSCFRGSIDDWIEISNPKTLKKLAKKYIKRLGTEGFYDLF
jgi:protein required for attachment to host cells